MKKVKIKHILKLFKFVFLIRVYISFNMNTNTTNPSNTANPSNTPNATNAANIILSVPCTHNTHNLTTVPHHNVRVLNQDWSSGVDGLAFWQVM
jgi:hypothetical protein